MRNHFWLIFDCFLVQSNLIIAYPHFSFLQGGQEEDDRFEEEESQHH